MSDENTAYYRAAGKSLAAILAWQEHAKEINLRRDAFRARYDVKSLYGIELVTGGSRVLGAIFDTDPPAPWRKRKRKGSVAEHWYPDRSVAGKLLQAELNTLWMNNPSSDAGDRFVFGSRMFSAGIQLVGCDWIISHHEKAPPPPDAIPMKRSEYWAMKEASMPDPA